MSAPVSSRPPRWWRGHGFLFWFFLVCAVPLAIAFVAVGAASTYNALSPVPAGVVVHPLTACMTVEQTGDFYVCPPDRNAEDVFRNLPRMARLPAYFLEIAGPIVLLPPLAAALLLAGVLWLAGRFL
jgi:hypothetical protein